MCFSATASFVTAGVTGAIGIIALTRVNQPREMPLATVPLFFALQQSIEGFLWLNLPFDPQGSIATGLPPLFLFLAEVFWPVYAPLTVLLIEPDATRRRLMLVCVAAGLSVSLYLLWWLLTTSHSATIVDDHIVYHSGGAPSVLLDLAYLVATGVSGMLSSRRTLVVLGAIILVGSAVAFAFYWEAFVSIWCFFAAAASGVILCHFQWAHWQTIRVAGARGGA